MAPVKYPGEWKKRAAKNTSPRHEGSVGGFGKETCHGSHLPKVADKMGQAEPPGRPSPRVREGAKGGYWPWVGGGRGGSRVPIVPMQQKMGGMGSVRKKKKNR